MPYPLEVHVGAGDWSLEEQEAIVEAAAQWQGAGSGLRLVIVAGSPKRECNADWCAVYPASGLSFNGHVLRGKTSSDGVQIDSAFAVKYYGLKGLQLTVEHELGHINGLGAPADGNEHVHAVGDVMCGEFDCVMMGDGKLSDADVSAMIAFREGHQ